MATDDETQLPDEVARLRQRLTQLESLDTSANEHAMLCAAEDLAQLGAFVWNASTKQATWSDGLRRILGISPDTVTSADEAICLAHADDRKRLYRLARLAVRGSEVKPTDFRVIRGDGTILHVIGHLRAVFDEAGALSALQGAIMDVTERRRLESQLLHSQKMEAIGTLAGGVAHDFNNFLQVIEGHADLIRLDPTVPRKTLISVEEISKAIERCQQLTQRLLAFGRKQDGTPTLNEVHSLVGATARMLSRVIGDDVELKLIADPHPCTIRIDPVQFEQVLVNLAVNARDAMPDGGTLEVRVDQIDLGPETSTPLSLAPGMYCRIEVRDTGVGMTESVQARVFEPFFTTKPVGTGTGLGLSTAHGIIHQAGGAIRVSSTLDVGTVFTLLFPISASEQGLARAVVDSRDYPTGNETILLVEDGEDVRSITKDQLERAGYTVLQAPNGETALDLANRHSGPIHLLITDVMMPRMSGPELAGRIQAKRPATCVVFMSGYTERLVLRRTALRSDRVSLHKPFSMQELLTCVREQLDALRQT